MRRRAKITPFFSSIYTHTLVAGGEGGGGEYGDGGVGGGHDRVLFFTCFLFSLN